MRIYYYHLKKCGGTTMNAWLDTLGSVSRGFSWAWGAGSGNLFIRTTEQKTLPPARSGRIIFEWSDIVHSHRPLRGSAPPDCFNFTMLRNPAKRLISQITDWRRLTFDDVARFDPEVRDCILDSGRLGISDYLTKHAQGAGRILLDNFMTRALAASRGGEFSYTTTNPRNLLQKALDTLHADFDFVGISEAFDLSQSALCSRLGLPPAGSAIALNVSVPMARNDDPELVLTPEEEEIYTGCDNILYKAACDLFNQRHRETAEGYDIAMFEARHATRLLAGLRGVCAGEATKYTVKEAFYGSGTHMRDGGRTGDHAVWTRSDCRAVLYIPVLDGMHLALLLWIRGYASAAQRAGLRVWVDGREVIPIFEPAEGYAELLVVPHFTSARFARLELEVPASLEDSVDTRARGVSFDAYGWRPL